MKSSRTRSVPTAFATASLLFAFSGCGGFDERPSAAAVSADMKTQVEQACREVGVELKTLPAPSDSGAQAKGQRQSEQIFRTAVRKVREQEATGGLPPSYKSWLDALEQLPALNEQAAEAADADGAASDAFKTASDRWAAQAARADALAREAGLENCLVSGAGRAEGS